MVRCVMSFRMRGMSSVVPLYQDHSSTSPVCVTNLYSTVIQFMSSSMDTFWLALGPPRFWPGQVPWVYICRLGMSWAHGLTGSDRSHTQSTACHQPALDTEYCDKVTCHGMTVMQCIAVFDWISLTHFSEKAGPTLLWRGVTSSQLRASIYEEEGRTCVSAGCRVYTALAWPAPLIVSSGHLTLATAVTTCSPVASLQSLSQHQWSADKWRVTEYFQLASEQTCPLRQCEYLPQGWYCDVMEPSLV